MVQQILLAPHVSTYIIGTTFSMYIIVITYYGLYFIISIISYGLYYWYHIYGLCFWHYMPQYTLMALHDLIYIIGITYIQYFIGITECVCIVLNHIHRYILVCTISISTTSRIS